MFNRKKKLMQIWNNLRASNDDIILIFGWIIPIRHYFIINITKTIFLKYSEKKNIWSPADFVRLPTDKEMISL